MYVLYVPEVMKHYKTILITKIWCKNSVQYIQLRSMQIVSLFEPFMNCTKFETLAKSSFSFHTITHLQHQNMFCPRTVHVQSRKPKCKDNIW